jgi:hypothetical protein
MKRLIFLLSVFTALTACTPSKSGTLGPAPTASPPPSAQPSSTQDPVASESTSPNGRSLTIQVWFTRGGKLFPTKRTAPYTLETSRLALSLLVAGPSAEEQGSAVGNAIPPNTIFDIPAIAGGAATVSFPAAFYADSPGIVRLREAQVVYTLTQYPTVSRVRFQATGSPLGRADFADLVPAIVVLSPSIGQQISSPVTVSGTADTREATVNAHILDASGREVATKFTTATCGSGCRGNYSMTISYQVCTEGPGFLEVWEISGEDGTRQNVVTIRVELAHC